MSRDFVITEDEILAALNRSGYLLESEISSMLADLGFFIESNQVIEDPITGKSREIDIIAEFYNFKSQNSKYKVASNTKFVIEIKNNLFPIVLLTKWEFSPNIEDWIGLKEALTKPENISYAWYDSYYERLIRNNDRIFTQYCSFQKKKANEELMALHPDAIHEGLSKITQYCEEMVKVWDKELIYEDTETVKKDEYFRHFLYMPVLLLNDDLYELTNGILHQVDSSILVFNYHFNKEPKMAYIFVLTKRGFPEFIKAMIELDEDNQQKMIKIKQEDK